MHWDYRIRTKEKLKCYNLNKRNQIQERQKLSNCTIKDSITNGLSYKVWGWSLTIVNDDISCNVTMIKIQISNENWYLDSHKVWIWVHSNAQFQTKSSNSKRKKYFPQCIIRRYIAGLLLTKGENQLDWKSNL